MTNNLQTANRNSESKMLINTFKPDTSRRNLLFIAALVWTFAGGMLLTKGILMMGIQTDF